MAIETPRRIGIINGSVRETSNTAGLIRWLEPIISSALGSDIESPPSVELDIIHLTSSPNHPLPLVLGPSIPAAITSASSYPEPSIAAWSETVSAWDAVIIVTPQYNWGIPALLKNSLDHLYHEWRGKPVGIVTMGGHGGGKCAEQLRTVCGGGLKMRVAEARVGVTLEREYITGAERIRGDEEWLLPYVEGARGLVLELKVMLQVGKGVKEAS